jgi:hypothetical protein
MKIITHISLAITALIVIGNASHGNTFNKRGCTVFFDEIRWQYRLLLVNIDDHQELYELKEYLDYSATELSSRRLLVIGVDKKVVQLSNNSLSCLPSLSETQKRLHKNKAILIGLDGGIKQQYDAVDAVRIFSDIDAMPIRRRERKGN